MSESAMQPEKGRFDLYKHITGEVVAALQEMLDGKREVPPWVRPWRDGNASRAHESSLPRNFARNTVYRGVNIMLLWMVAGMRGYQHDLWASFKEVVAMGAKVKKGAKGAMVTFWKVLYFDAATDRPLPEAEGKRREAEDRGSVKVVPLLRYFTVFNIGDCEDLPESVVARYGMGGQAPEVTAEPTPAIDPNIRWLMGLGDAAGVCTTFGGDRACYYPIRDVVLSPPLEAYRTIEDGFSTLAHEYGHATGHPQRLNRNMHGRFGDPAYAFEELIAEMTAGFVCGIRGVSGKLQHVEYIHHWMTTMKADPKAVFKAAKAAQDATEFLVGERKSKAGEGAESASDEAMAPAAAA